jgi:hypothetical protein
MSCDIEEKRRKLTFCSRKRKSSSDISVNSLNKIFTITKDKSHKNSLDITKNKNIFVNNLKQKDNSENNNNFYPKKFNINHNFIINKITKITPTNSLKKNENLNNPINPNNDFNIKNGNIFIQNNIYNIYNNFGNEIHQNNNNINNNYEQNIFINNNNKNNNNYQNTNLRTVIFNPDLKTLKKNKIKNNQYNTYEDKYGNNDNQYIINNQNLFAFNSNQDNNKTIFENEQYNPFNLEFDNFASNDKKLFNDDYKHNNNFSHINEQFGTMSDKTNNLYINE